MDTVRSRGSGVTMKKRPITLIEILEYGPFQFWFLFVVTASFYVVLRSPRADEFLQLSGASLVAACGILGVIFLTEHADNSFRKMGLWVNAVVASWIAFSVCLIIGPLAWLFPVVLVLPAVLQGFALSLAVEEDFRRCFWWSFGGGGLVVMVLVFGACVYSMLGSVIG